MIYTPGEMASLTLKGSVLNTINAAELTVRIQEGDAV